MLERYHGDFPELSRYLSGDQHSTDSEESQSVHTEDPKSDSNVCQDQFETHAQM